MHVLGILYLCLFLGAFLSLGDVVGARRFDRMRALPSPDAEPPADDAGAEQ